MFSVAPNIVLAPNMTQNAERKHRTQDTDTAPIRPQTRVADLEFPRRRRGARTQTTEFGAKTSFLARFSLKTA